MKRGERGGASRERLLAMQARLGQCPPDMQAPPEISGYALDCLRAEALGLPMQEIRPLPERGRLLARIARLCRKYCREDGAGCRACWRAWQGRQRGAGQFRKPVRQGG